MLKLVEKLKTILPTNVTKILFPILLYIACSCLTFVYINFLQIHSVGLTILAIFGIGLGVFIVVESLILLPLKFVIAPINIPQYFVIFNLVFAIEIFALACTHFVSMLISPYLYLIIGLLSFFICAGMNISLEYNMYNEITKDKIKYLNFVKIYNISIVSIILVVWLIL